MSRLSDEFAIFIVKAAKRANCLSRHLNECNEKNDLSVSFAKNK